VERALQEPVGVRLDALVPLAVRRTERTVYNLGWLESNDFPGLSFTPPDVEVLDGRELGPSDVVLGCPHHPL
jgi:hypothetical protein